MADHHYLTPDQLRAERYYGIAVTWVGDESEAIALTGDHRRGAAALHALGRASFLRPVRSGDRLTRKYARFWDFADGAWSAEFCSPSSTGAHPVIYADELTDYLPNPSDDEPEEPQT